jgi:FkbM family methyltransferase
MKESIRGSLRRLGVDVRRARNAPNVIDFLKDRQINVVLDVGANEGQFGAFLRTRGYRGKIVSFEPIESVFKCLATKAKADGNWEIHNFALGASLAETKINVADSSVYSSILTSTSTATLYDSRTAVRRTELIKVRTLDEVASNLSGNILLKIDTQGYEKPVLEGGLETLSKLKGVLMELPIIHLYEATGNFMRPWNLWLWPGLFPRKFTRSIFIQRIAYPSLRSIACFAELRAKVRTVYLGRGGISWGCRCLHVPLNQALRHEPG